MRISALPLFFRCPSSQLPVAHPYDVPSDAADLGSAVHECLAAAVTGGEPDLPTTAARYGLRPDDLNALYRYGLLAWDEVRTTFPTPQVEVTVEAGGLRGHADVLQTGERLAILDWKTNRQRTEYRAQLRGYGACAVEQYGWPRSGRIELYIAWLRLFEIDLVVMTPADVDAFWQQFTEAAAEIGKRYAPGDACTYCRRQLVCEARHEFARSAATALTAATTAEMEAALLPRLYGQARMLGKVLDQYNDALRLLLRDGPQPDGQGNWLELAETRRAKVDARLAWPVLLSAGFSEDDLAACTDIRLGALWEVAARHAPEGEKGKAKSALREELQQAGAVTETVHPTIRLKKGDKQ